MTRSEIVADARTWIGTKWQHQAGMKGIATDCIGLIKGVYEDMSGNKVTEQVNYASTWHLFKKEEVLYSAVKNYATEILSDARLPGDIILFAFGKGPAHHAGILTEKDKFVHAYAETGKVVEVTLDDFWRKHIKYVFKYPGVTE
jgi:NlpC/P60 family putative phage cell wall peptidase